MFRSIATPFRRLAGATALCALVSGCANPEVAADRLDPSRVDPGGLRVFVALPEGQAPLPGYPRMILALRVAGGDGREADLPLVPVADPRSPGGATAYAVSPQDAEVARGVGAALDAARAAGRSGSLAVEIAIETCRIGPVGEGSVRVWTAASPDAAARPLAMPAPPGAVARAYLDAKPPCP